MRNPGRLRAKGLSLGVTVLYVTGWCRSGSTVLGNVLAEAPGVVHAGELRYLWLNGALGQGSNSRCGCGAQLASCPLWSRVLEAVRPAGRTPLEHAADVVACQRRRFRTRHTWRTLRRPPRDTWAATLGATYHAVARLTGAEAVARAHREASLRLRYEELTADPRGSVARILALLGRPAANPVREDGTVEVGENHTVTGNPDRFRRGTVALREDRAWRQGLPRPQRLAVTVLALPLLARYGYL